MPNLPDDIRPHVGRWLNGTDDRADYVRLYTYTTPGGNYAVRIQEGHGYKSGGPAWFSAGKIKYRPRTDLRDKCLREEIAKRSALQRCKHCGLLCTADEGKVCNECYSEYTPSMLADMTP